MFVYKHTETIENVKSRLIFKKDTKFTGEFLGLRKKNFQDVYPQH